MRCGYTLIEMVMSAVIISIILVAVGSAMVIASRALPDDDGPTQAANEAAGAINQMAGDLAYALSFFERTATAITFFVPDRNGDSGPEVIRYAWSGVAGSPLTRAYNGGPATNVLEHVYALTFAYDTYVVTTSVTEDVESPEILLASHSGLLGSSADFAIDSNHWPGQYLKPTMPGGATGWRITRVRLPARLHGGNGGLTSVELYAADAAGLPIGAMLGSQTMVESSLGVTYSWQQFTYPGASRLKSTQGACLILRHLNDADAADAQYDILSVAPSPGTRMITTANGGSSWTGNDLQSLLFEVYGTITTSTTTDVSTSYLTGVSIDLQAGSAAESRRETAVQILNAPQVN